MFTFYPLNLSILRDGRALSLAAALLALNVQAQTTNQQQALRQAFDAAWLHNPSRAFDSHHIELQARQRAAARWFYGEPLATVAHRTDRFSQNEGFRDVDAELELPLWNPGVRAATQNDISAQQQLLDDQFALARLKLAGELRTLVANAAAAQVDIGLSQRKLAEAQALAQDLGRRVKAGESARVDVLQVQTLVHQVQAALAQANSQLTRLQHQWQSITGLPTIAPLQEALTHFYGDAAVAVPSDHPAQRHVQSQVRSAQAKLALADTDQRDPMAVAVGVALERPRAMAASDLKLRIALRVPLGGDNRNGAKQAAARTELNVAQAQADAVMRTLKADLAIAAADLQAAQLAQEVARERLRLSTEVQMLMAKSWRLGESDLPTRLRADNEQFEAQVLLARATLDIQRAISNLNQAYGQLP